ncbi:MAG: hypothetical protein HFG49_03130 [Lachnospiraceae bacterium]|nr:hypothetical protein [Lachnospiraceae bacterium]
MKDICIYGFGIHGIRIYYLLKEKNISIKCFIDRDENKQGYAIDGLQCINFRNISLLDRESTILIVAISNSQNLISEFKNMGFLNVYDKNYIYDNCNNLLSVSKPLCDIDKLENIKIELERAIYKNEKLTLMNEEVQSLLYDYLKRKEKMNL